MTGPQRTAVVLLVWLALWLAVCLLMACTPVDGNCGGETDCQPTTGTEPGREAPQVDPGGPPPVRDGLPGGPAADHAALVLPRRSLSGGRTPGHPHPATTETPATATTRAAGAPTQIPGA